MPIARFIPMALLVLLASLALSVPARAQAPANNPAPDESAVGFVEITPELRTSVARGLAYLASVQDADGSFGASRGQDVAITSLSLLAFMADGHTPGRGQYGTVVEKGLDYILRNVQDNGLIAVGNSGSPMYGHGFSTLFLGEVYGMTQDKRVKEALVKATR